MTDKREIVPLWFVFELREYSEARFAGRMMEANISIKTGELKLKRLSEDSAATEDMVRQASEYLTERHADVRWYGRAQAMTASAEFMAAMDHFFEVHETSYLGATHEEIEALLQKDQMDLTLPLQLVNLNLAWWGALQECALPFLKSA